MQGQEIEILKNKLAEAEAIIIGGASGMSAAAGYDWYGPNELFFKYFGKFAAEYGIDSIFGGFYYKFASAEERWAYIITLIKCVLDMPLGQPYKDLSELLDGKNYFILTTNQDLQFSRAFPSEKVAAIQGDWSYWQCSRKCHDRVYPNQDLVEQLFSFVEGTRLPSDLLPSCAKCGRHMQPWVRSRVFLEGERFHSERAKYNAFLENNMNGKILFLELGVGRMTPMYIQEPFWNLTRQLPTAYYITINPRHALLPDSIKTRGLAISDDIAKVMASLLADYKTATQ